MRDVEHDFRSRARQQLQGRQRLNRFRCARFRSSNRVHPRAIARAESEAPSKASISSKLLMPLN